jgi:hypothetical protein
MDQAVALWKVMFLSKGMMSFKGVWRNMEMKFRQTGSRMKAASTWRMRAAVRETTDSQVGTGPSAAEEEVHKRILVFRGRKLHTVAVAEHRPRPGKVVVQFVVDEAKGEDQEVEEDPDEEKQAAATLINHPDAPFVKECLGLVWPLRSGTGSVCPLKGLQTPSFGLVSLEVAGLGGPVGVRLLEIRVLVQLGELAAVGKVEAGGPLHPAEVGGHWESRNGWGACRLATSASVGVGG